MPSIGIPSPRLAKTRKRLVLGAALIAPLLWAGSARATNVDNDCITESWQPAGGNLFNEYWKLDWSDSDGPVGSIELDKSVTSYTWCSAQPRTSYSFTLTECERRPDPFPDFCKSASPQTLTTKFSLMNGGDFETQTSSQLSSNWGEEGTAPRGVDLNRGYAHNGANNAWIRGTGTGWNAITQTWALGPNFDFRYTGWVRTSSNVQNGYFGVRNGSGQIVGEVKFGPVVGDYTRLAVSFRTSNHWDAYTMYVGFWLPGPDAWIQIDDLWLTNGDVP
jgi:hypothetical protein